MPDDSLEWPAAPHADVLKPTATFRAPAKPVWDSNLPGSRQAIEAVEVGGRSLAAAPLAARREQLESNQPTRCDGKTWDAFE